MSQNPRATTNRPNPRRRNKEIGAKGERRAAAFLVAGGYTELRRNWRLAGGEIDLLMTDTAGTLIVVEVKTRSSSVFGRPQDNITLAKLRTLRRLARAVSSFYPERNVQVDIVEIDLESDEINHLSNILS